MNEHHVIRKCPHVVHFNVPRVRFETKSRHQDRYSEEGKKFHNWEDLRSTLASRFQILNKEKLAFNKPAKRKQLKDVVSFNEEFHRILLYILNISNDEQIDRYTRALKPYIFN